MAYKKTTNKPELNLELKNIIHSEISRFIEKLKILDEELDLLENFEFKRNYLMAERAEIKNKLANFKFLKVTSRKIAESEIQERTLKAYLDAIEAKIEAFTLEKEVVENKNELPKIKWNSKPAVFGYLFGKLAENGLIDAPQLNNVTFFKGYTELLMQHFELDTTPGYLAKELSASSISDAKKAKFGIPYLKDLL